MLESPYEKARRLAAEKDPHWMSLSPTEQARVMREDMNKSGFGRVTMSKGIPSLPTCPNCFIIKNPDMLSDKIDPHTGDPLCRDCA
jgi:hypothetical protein